jgi:nitrite reductase (NADH) large subunit
MRVLVVGNGLAGTIASKTLHELDPSSVIQIYAEENYPYYPRPNLIEFLAGNVSRENLFAFSNDWYAERNISVHLGQPVVRLHSGSKEIELDGGVKESFDVLLLANGASSWMPPISGAEKKGVFALRSLDDAADILDWADKHPKVAIIGGGLLGLEIARAIRSRGAEVQVVEFFPRLLPRQLDTEGAAVLQSQIEKMGIDFRLGMATEEIQGEGRVEGLRFKSGESMKAQTAIVAAGVRPNTSLAAEAGLETDKGIIVDDTLRTSHPDIFAAGDNVQHRERIYGIIPASFNQARTVAFNMLGQEKIYEGTVPSNTLKVVGLDLTAIGNVTPEEGTCEEFRKTIKEEGVYKKIVVQNGKLVGAIWMGTKKNVNEVNRLILQQIDVEQWKGSLLDDDFDFSVL